MGNSDSAHRRFFISPSQLRDGEVRIEGLDAHQIVVVLRLKVGDQVTVLDGSGAARTARITEVARSVVAACVMQTEYPDTEPRVYLTLAQALPKRCKLELIVQKACELGISEVVGLITERTICRPVKEKWSERVDRWQRVAKEAAEQCARAKIPTVRGVCALNALLGEIPEYDVALVAHEEERDLLLSTALKQNAHAKRVLLMIGPEGGFTEQEIGQLLQRSAKTVSLGKRLLRTETAAIAACAIILNTLEGHL